MLYGLSLSSSGFSAISLAQWLRGPEEEGWNWLMLIGTLLVLLGIVFAVIRGGQAMMANNEGEVWRSHLGDRSRVECPQDGWSQYGSR